MALSTKEICSVIASDFKRQRITHQMAAERIGTTKQTISNQISGKKRFSQAMAKKFSDQFGYSIPWLLYGEGEKYKEGHVHLVLNAQDEKVYYSGNLETVLKEGRKLRMAERLLQILNNKVAISAFNAYLAGDYEEYETLLDKLESDYAYDLPHYLSDPKAANAFRWTRQFFTDVETKAAKELVRIEHQAASGEIIDVDAEVERFKRRVILIKDAFKDKALENHPHLTEEEYQPESEKAAIKELIPENYRNINQ